MHCHCSSVVSVAGVLVLAGYLITHTDLLLLRRQQTPSSRAAGAQTGLSPT